MLIEFRVENFRSFRDEQSLLLTAYTNKGKRSRQHLETNTFPCPALPDEGRLLTSAGVYGPNASGKSNLCAAVWTFKRMLMVMGPSLLEADSENMDSPKRRPPIDPFLLDDDFSSRPTSFEISLVADLPDVTVDPVRYQYGFTITGYKINKEWLFFYPEGRSRTLFFRDPGGNIRFPGDNLKGEKVSLSDKTTESNLFLNVAAAFNHPQLKPLHDWMRRHLHVVGERTTFATGPGFEYTLSYADSSEEARQLVVDVLRSADLGITDFRVLDEEGARRHQRAEFLHSRSGSEEPVYFDLLQESAGTRRLFWLLGPILDGLHDGDLVFLDEIQTSLHPLLSRKILGLFNNPETNPKHAQLVFTTHDTTLMDKSFMRRDQIWFVEKDTHGASHLYPLLDYRPKENESLGKGYLEGRYGAIPLLGDWTF